MASNQITLAAGTYLVSISAPITNSTQHQARLRDITNGVTLLVGTTEYASTGGASTRSWLCGVMVLAASTVLEIQQRVATGQATYGFGLAANFGQTEVYGVAEFWKV